MSEELNLAPRYLTYEERDEIADLLNALSNRPQDIVTRKVLETLLDTGVSQQKSLEDINTEERVLVVLSVVALLMMVVVGGLVVYVIHLF